MIPYHKLQEAISQARLHANAVPMFPSTQQAVRLLADFAEERGKRPRFVRLFGPDWAKTFSVHTGEGSGFINGGIYLAVTEPSSYVNGKLCTDPSCLHTPHYTNDRQCVSYDSVTVKVERGGKITHIHL